MGNPGMNGLVSALAFFDDGNGSALYAGGEFTTAGGVTVNRIAKLNGNVWLALPGGGMNGAVRALVVFNDDSGPALYAGGDFTMAGGVSVSRIARWNGTSWSAVGSDVNGNVRTLAIFDSGSGPELCAGGEFTQASGLVVNRVARWRPGLGMWWPLGTGTNAAVYTLTAYNDGNGPALYAGGLFTQAGGASVSALAKWNGSAWLDVGGGVHMIYHAGDTPYVNDLEVFDDGTGPGLYVAGWFDRIGTIGWWGIGRWDADGWSTVGDGLAGTGGNDPSVSSIGVFDDGASGLTIYISGIFEKGAAHLMARLNRGTNAWLPVGSGVGEGIAQVLVGGVEQGIPALYAGGSFTLAGGQTANRIAKWGCSLLP